MHQQQIVFGQAKFSAELGADLGGVRRGAAVAGNLKQWPATVGDSERWRQISLFREGGLAAEEMGIVTTRLGDGRVLLTGEVLEAQAQLARASQAAFLYALAAGILLAAAVAWIAAWILARRVPIM